MTDHRDDDTQFWHDPDWNRTGDLPAIRPDDESIARSHRLGQLARDVTGSIQLTRGHTFERTRSHHVVTTRPIEHHFVDATDDWAPVDHWLEPEPNERRAAAGIDLRLLRIGAIVAAGVLLVPIALALREDDGELRADGAAVTATLAPEVLAAPAATMVTVPPAAAPVAAPASVAAPADRSQTYAVAAAASAEPECAGTYVVIANDFWNRFPKTSGASVEAWLAANGATADTPLYVGDELCIPAGATAPAPPPATTTPTAAPVTTPAPAAVQTTAPTAAPTTQSPVTTAAPVPVVTKPPAPAVTTPPAPISAGAPSTEALCGAMPTTNGNPAGTASPAQVEAIIREIWPDDIEVRALCIAKREAKLRADLNNWCCYGVFALYFEYVPKDLRALYGVDEPADLHDARTNVAIAYQIYRRGGWDPWSQTDPGSG